MLVKQLNFFFVFFFCLFFSKPTLYSYSMKRSGRKQSVLRIKYFATMHGNFFNITLKNVHNIKATHGNTQYPFRRKVRLALT